MNSYKLVQFLRTYVNPEEIETSITICSRITQKWLDKLRYEYNHLCKNIFINGYKQANIIEDYKNFFKRLEELKFYIIGFEKNSIKKPKIYFANCAIREDERYLIIIFTHNAYIFFASNGI